MCSNNLLYKRDDTIMCLWGVSPEEALYKFTITITITNNMSASSLVFSLLSETILIYCRIWVFTNFRGRSCFKHVTDCWLNSLFCWAYFGYGSFIVYVCPVFVQYYKYCLLQVLLVWAGTLIVWPTHKAAGWPSKEEAVRSILRRNENGDIEATSVTFTPSFIYFRY